MHVEGEGKEGRRREKGKVGGDSVIK